VLPSYRQTFVYLSTYLSVSLFTGETANCKSNGGEQLAICTDYKITKYTRTNTAICCNHTTRNIMFTVRLADYHSSRSLGSSVSIVTSLRADRPGLDCRQRQVFFSLRHRVQSDSGAHAAFCPMMSLTH
jgi:hypothetical protein